MILVEIKFLKVGGLIVRERGYVATPPAIKAKSQTPLPSTSKNQADSLPTLNLKKARFGCRRTTTTQADTPNVCVNLIARKGRAQGVSHNVYSYYYQKRESVRERRVCQRCSDYGSDCQRLQAQS